MAKNTFRILACIVLVLSFTIALSSCEKIDGIFENGLFNKHEHSYAPTVTQPTCTERGYTTYTCECGDSYVDNYVEAKHNLTVHNAKEPTCTEVGWNEYFTCNKCDYTTYSEIEATGHDYQEKITRYPTTVHTGIKSTICSVCSDTIDEQIDAVSVTLPRVASLLRTFIGNNRFNISADNTEIIFIQEIEKDGGNGNAKQFIAIDLTRLDINGTGDEIAVHIDFELGVATVEDYTEGTEPVFTSQSVVSIFLEGDDLSVALTENGSTENGEYDITEQFYTYIASYLGMSYEELAETYYLVCKIVDYLPALEELLEMFGSVELPTDAPDLSPIVNTLLDSVVTVDEDGYCHLDLDKLIELVESLKTKTVGQIVDEQFGKGSMTAIETFLVALPMTKVKTLVKSANALAESYGIPIDDIYALINYAVYVYTGEDFNIEYEIKSRYNKTIAEVVVELTNDGSTEITDAEINIMALGMVNSFKEIISQLKKSNVDQLYNYYQYNDPNYDYSLTDDIIGYIEILDAALSLSWHVSEDGELDALNVTVTGLFGLIYDFVGENMTLGAVVFIPDGPSIELTASATATKASLTLKSDGYEMVSFEALIDGEQIVDASFRLNALCIGKLEGYDSTETLVNVITFSYVKGEGADCNSSLVLNMIYKKNTDSADEQVYVFENFLDLNVAFDGVDTYVITANGKVTTVTVTSTDDGAQLDVVTKDGETVIADFDTVVKPTLNDEGVVTTATVTLVGTLEGKSVDLTGELSDGKFSVVYKVDGNEILTAEIFVNTIGFEEFYDVEIVVDGVNVETEIIEYLKSLLAIVEDLGVLENLPAIPENPAA